MTTDLLSGLTPEQREAVLHRDGPLLILAGAGSGKTRTITRRIAHLVATGVPRRAILAITFTNKAAGEMRERVQSLLPPEPARGSTGPTVSTFHSFAARLLREHAPRLGYSRDFTILDPDDQLGLIREAAVAARVDVERWKAPALGHVIGRAKERLDDTAFAAEATTELDLAAVRALPIYRRLLRDRDAVDFDDLVALCVGLLDTHRDVREALLHRLRYVMIDEYQDTNHAQYRLARLLAGERENLAVCGDPDQSIYGWRGADMKNILRFEEDFPGAKVVRLEKNYRSTATILRAANHLIGHNLVRKEKQLLPTGEEGGPIEVKRCIDEDLEAELVARRVEEAIAQGTPAGEVAVVFRAGAMARKLEDALARRGVPCSTTGAVSFLDRREVKDALAWLRLAVNPRDDLAALRAIRNPPRGLGDRTFDRLGELQRAHGIPLAEACGRAGEVPGLSKHARAALEGFAGIVRELGQAAEASGERLAARALERSGLTEHVKARDPDQAEARAASLRALVEAAREADRRAARAGDLPSGRALLDHLALLDAQDKDDEDDRRQKVTLTTVHAAKGLEFDVVFCCGLEEGLFPHERALAEGGLEEERRLAYVAFTRARKRLVITYASLRAARSASKESRRASTFLYELPPELLWDPERKARFELPDREPATPRFASSAPGPQSRPAARLRPAAGKPLWARPLASR